jgi:hypothetical protein
MNKTETLWVYLPEREQQAINNIIQYIGERELGSCSVDNLLNQLSFNRADDWIQALSDYNQMLSKKIILRNMPFKVAGLQGKFQKYQSGLNARNFESHELLALVILYYENPALISQKLCSALTAENSNDIYKAIIDNSDLVRKTRAARMTAQTSNLRLLNYALYANDSSVQLTDEIKDKIIADAAKKNITVIIETDRSNVSEDLSNSTESSTVTNGSQNNVTTMGPNNTLSIQEQIERDNENREYFEILPYANEEELVLSSHNNATTRDGEHEVQRRGALGLEGTSKWWMSDKLLTNTSHLNFWETIPKNLSELNDTLGITGDDAYNTGNTTDLPAGLTLLVAAVAVVASGNPVVKPVYNILSNMVNGVTRAVGNMVEGTTYVAGNIGSFFRPASVANSTEIQNAVEQKATFNR